MNFLQAAASIIMMSIASVTLGLIGFFHVTQHSVAEYFDRGQKVGVTNSSQQVLPEAAIIDCKNGRPLYDRQGQPTLATITATHVYAYVWDGTTSNNDCGTYTLPNADPSTFVALDAFYAVDKNNVWFINTPTLAGAPNFYRIAGADPSTFSLIFDPYMNDFDTAYMKDKAHVFYNGEIVASADPLTFTLVDPHASANCPSGGQADVDAKDATQTFFRGRNSALYCHPPGS
jgi:hypothetical protein